MSHKIYYNQLPYPLSLFRFLPQAPLSMGGASSVYD